MAEWLSSAEASRRLGVKPASLYAYASRGQLRRRTGPDGRRSEYHPDDVATLAVRGRRSRPMQPTDVVVPTAITAIIPVGPTYRGVPAVDLAGDETFEAVADLLWESPHEPDAWRAAAEVPDPVPTTSRAHGGLDAGQRLLAVTVGLRAADPLGRDLRPTVVVATARRLLGALAASLGGGSAPGTPLAEVVARSLGTEVGDAAVRAVDAALVLLADHELAASTLAVRVAASARCDPYAAELAGLAVLTGPRHGAASRGLEIALTEVAAGAPATGALAAAAAGSSVGGFGHPLYPNGDPRAIRLLEVLEAGDLGPRLGPLR
ncbi:MAG: hypothetical protein KG028_00215, partial [Actinobacteria bacterium]|nr:hypothetical protein [Actinomycetota bacterium]